MRRLQIKTKGGSVVGQGAEWPDGTVSIWMEGFGSHSFDGKKAAAVWVDQQRLEKGHTLETLDAHGADPKAEGKLPSERAEELLTKIASDEAKHSAFYDALELRYAKSKPSSMDMVLATELALLKQALDERLGRSTVPASNDDMPKRVSGVPIWHFDWTCRK